MDGHRRYADEPQTPSWYTGSGLSGSGSSALSSSPPPDPYAGAGPYESGVHERPSGAFRLPDQRTEDSGYSSYGTSDPLTTGGSRGFGTEDSGGGRLPVRGPEYPTIRPSGTAGGTSLADAPPVSSAPTYPASTATTYPAASTATAYPAASTATTYSTTTSTTTFPAAPSSPGTYGGGVPSSTIPAAAEPTGVVPPLASRLGTVPEPVYRSRRPVSAIAIAAVTVLIMAPVIMLLVRVTFVDTLTVRGVVPAVLLTLGLPSTGIGLYALAAGGGSGGRDGWLRPPVVYLPVGLFLLLTAAIAVA